MPPGYTDEGLRAAIAIDVLGYLEFLTGRSTGTVSRTCPCTPVRLRQIEQFWTLCLIVTQQHQAARVGGYARARTYGR